MITARILFALRPTQSYPIVQLSPDRFLLSVILRLKPYLKSYPATL